MTCERSRKLCKMFWKGKKNPKSALTGVFSLRGIVIFHMEIFFFITRQYFLCLHVSFDWICADYIKKSNLVTWDPSALKWSKACFLKSPRIVPSSLFWYKEQIRWEKVFQIFLEWSLNEHKWIKRRYAYIVNRHEKVFAKPKL